MTVGDFKRFCAEMQVPDDAPLQVYDRIGPADLKRAVFFRYKDSPQLLLCLNTVGRHMSDEWLSEIERIGTVGGDGKIFPG